MNLQKIFDDTDFVHTSGTKEELQIAEYLKAQCETLGAKTYMEAFRGGASVCGRRGDRVSGLSVLRQRKRGRRAVLYAGNGFGINCRGKG